MRASTFLVIVGLTNAYQSCTEFCNLVSSGHTNALFKSECDCGSGNQLNVNRNTARRSMIDDSPIYYESEDPNALSFLEQPFYLIKPVLQKSTNQDSLNNKLMKPINNKHSAIGIVEKSKVNNNKKEDIVHQEDAETEEFPLYLDIDIYKVKSNTEQTAVQLTSIENIQELEKHLIECIDFHILVSSRRAGNKLNDVWDEKKINKYSSLSDSDLMIKIESKCDQPIHVVNESLMEIKASLPKKTSNKLKHKQFTAAKWIDMSNPNTRVSTLSTFLGDNVVSEQWITIPPDLKSNTLAEPTFPTFLLEKTSTLQDESNSITSFPPITTFQSDWITEAQSVTTSPLINKNYSFHSKKHDHSLANVGEIYININNKHNNSIQTNLSAQNPTQELLSNDETNTNYLGFHDDSNENIILKTKDLTTNVLSDSDLMYFTSTEGLTALPRSEEDVNITMPSIHHVTQIYLKSSSLKVDHTTEIRSIDENPDETLIAGPSPSENETYKFMNIERNDDEYEKELQTKNPYLFKQIKDAKEKILNEKNNKITESILTAPIEYYVNNSESTTSAVTIQNYLLSSEYVHKEIIESNNNKTLNDLATKNKKLFHQTGDEKTTANYTNQRLEYHEKDMILPKIITREFRNGTVMSEINGTEVLLNNDFFEDSKNNTKGDFNPENIGNIIKASEEIVGRLVFIFDNHTVPARFVQNSDGRINLGLEGVTLCQKIAQNVLNNSLILSALCK